MCKLKGHMVALGMHGRDARDRISPSLKPFFFFLKNFGDLIGLKLVATQSCGFFFLNR